LTEQNLNENQIHCSFGFSCCSDYFEAVSSWRLMPQHRQHEIFCLLLCIGATHTIFPLDYYSAHPKQPGIEGEASSILKFISRFRGGNSLNGSIPTKLRHAASENLLTSNICVEGRSSDSLVENEGLHKNSKFKMVNGGQRGGQVAKLSGGRGFGSLGKTIDQYARDQQDVTYVDQTSPMATDAETDNRNVNISQLSEQSVKFLLHEKKKYSRQTSNHVFPHYHPVAGLLSTSSAFQPKISHLKLRTITPKNGLMSHTENSVTSETVPEISNIEPELCPDQNAMTCQDPPDSLVADVHNESDRVLPVIEEAAESIEKPTPDITTEVGQTEISIPLQREDSLNLTTVEATDLVESVRALCTQGEVESALEVVRTDLRNISHPQCTAILHEFAMAGRADCAQAALLHMQVVGVEVGIGLDSATYEELLLAYARDEATRSDEGLDQAFSVLDLMTRGGVEADLIAYNRLMEACSAAADSVDTYERGLRLLEIMRERGVKPTVETYNTLLEAVGRRGWSRDNGGGLDRGAALLARMTEDNVSASTDTFNMLMYGCAWAAGAGDGWGGVERGLGFLEAMAEMSAMPDVITFNNLIAACAQVNF
jgi:hypothetical protein